MWRRDARCTGLNEPDFETDPTAWFDWFDDCMSGDGGDGGGQQPACRPGRFIGPGGRCWMKVCTPDGEEIRPCFDHIARVGTLIAVRFAQDGYVLEIATERGPVFRKLARGQVPLSKLAAALIHHAKLPSNDPRKIPAEFWARQKRIVVRSPSQRKAHVPAAFASRAAPLSAKAR